VIDFAKTRHGHTAFDFAKLEVEIKTQILSEHVATTLMEELVRRPAKQEEAFRQCFARLYDLDSGGELEGGRDGLSRVWGEAFERAVRPVWPWIEQIRRMAIRDRGMSPQEYFLGVFFYSVAALKFTNLERLPISGRDLPVPRLVAFVSASAMAERLEAMGLDGSRPAGGRT
jgi:hypothetical protein